ncbi:MAG: gliding motility lipoprotein GldH [Muribaculaceae bacterium]|nr:gliding motility lipoprotein GldH [Muribaculaceae bacterium]
MRSKSFIPITALCVALGMIIMLGACRRDILWSESKSIPAAGWTFAQPLDFVLDPAAYEPPLPNKFAEYTARAIGDTTERIIGSYHAALSLRYRHNCNAEAVALIAEKYGLNEPTVCDTLCFRLFNTDGAPTGKGRLGIFETTIQLPGIFRVKEGTILSIRPIEYADTISGITDITLFLSR